MNVLILTIGTRGDVQPHVALGIGLNDAGHDVTLCTSPRYRPLFEGHSVAFALLSDDIVALVESAEGRAAIDDLSELVSGVRAVVRLLREHGQIQRDLVRDGWAAAQEACPDLIVYHPKMAAGLHYAEKLGVPAVMAPLYPLFLPTAAYPNLGLPPLNLGPLTATYNRVSHHLVRAVVRAATARYVRAWRAEHGLPRLPWSRGLLRTTGETRVPFLNGWSEHVAPNPPDWPCTGVETTGYWFLNRANGWTPSPALRAFLDAGAPPVYVGFGSMAGRHPQRTAEVVLDALRRTGQRAILARGWGGLEAASLPASVHRLDRVPHDWLFPRCAAVVHHGGAGTTAAGLRAGRPTVICPFFGDQPFWGRRVAALGTGPAPIPQAQLTADRLAAALEDATTRPVRERAQEVGTALRQEDGLARAVDALERLAARRPMPSRSAGAPRERTPGPDL